MEYTFEGVTLVSDGEMDEDEARAYIERGLERYDGHACLLYTSPSPRDM